MGLKHLQVAVWAIGLVSAVGALGQDSDGDGVPDNAPDHCPSTPGVATNYGCPADWGVLIVHGWWYDDADDPFDWVTDYALCPDGTLHVSYDQCPDYGYWGVFAVAYYGHGSHINTIREDDGYRPQPTAEEQFADVDCDDGITACWTLGDWAAYCNIVGGTAIPA